MKEHLYQLQKIVIKKKFLLDLYLAVSVFLIFASTPYAATYTATSCTASAVQAAMNQATNDGDIVSIPAGTCNWSNGVSWSPPPNAALKGAGNTNIVGGGDLTVIIDNYSNSNGALLNLSVQSSGTFRMYGFTIKNGTGGVKNTGMVKITGPGIVRLDHLHFDMVAGSSHTGKYLYIGGGVRGVLDNSAIETKSINWIHVVNGSDYAGDTEWSKATGFGTSDFFFIEDCVADNSDSNEQWYRGALTDCHTGGKYVVRYNTLIATSPAQTHPTGHSNGVDRGCRAHENYGNTITSPLLKEPSFAFDYNNSGPAMVWGNSFDQVFKNIMYFNICRTSPGDCGYSQSSPPNGWGYCNGSSVWDKNSEGNGYACIDQPGRGQGDLLSGTTASNRLNTATGTKTWPKQALEPVYEWLNTGNIVSGWGGAWEANQDRTHIAKNRDYYMYRGNSGCNQGAGSCTTGVGSGTRAQRPPNCTTGVAWWSTDQGGNWNTSNGTSNDGTLDKCTSTNVWANAFYTPYTYPHPLRKGGSIVNTLPDPPNNLRIINW